MKSVRNITVILSIALILAQATLSALTNYATVKLPNIFEDNPKLLMLSILFCIVVIIYTTIRIERGSRQDDQGLSAPLNKESSISSSQHTSKSDTIYDIFISYSHHDADWVNNILVPKLESHSFSILIDTKFSAGKFGVLQMEEGVQYCKRIVAVFTPEYFKSEWATLENIMAQTLDPATRQRKLIPILLKNTKIPLRLSVINYRDFTSLDENKWNLLIRDLI